MPAAVVVCGVLPPFSRCILPVALTTGDKATATMADIESEAETQCPKELPEYTSAAPTIRTDSVEADPQNSQETRSVREMEEGVVKAKMRACYDEYNWAIWEVLWFLAPFVAVGLILLFVFVILSL